MAKWSEIHIPKTLDEYIFSSNSDRTKVEAWVKKGFLGHSLFFGYPGTGKTTLAKMLPALLGINAFDVTLINASQDFSKSFVVNSLEAFMNSNGSSGGQRIVIIDEADELTKSAQKMLMGIITKYGKLGVTFYIAANSIAKFEEPIKSRCAGCIFITNTPDRDAILARLVEILIKENIQFTESQVIDLESLIDLCYPRMRDIIDELEQACHTGELVL